MSTFILCFNSLCIFASATVAVVVKEFTQVVSLAKDVFEPEAAKGASRLSWTAERWAADRRRDHFQPHFDLVREMKNAYNCRLCLVARAKHHAITRTSLLFVTTAPPTVSSLALPAQLVGPHFQMH